VGLKSGLCSIWEIGRISERSSVWKAARLVYGALEREGKNRRFVRDLHVGDVHPGFPRS
jgi:hypothetical protein